MGDAREDDAVRLQYETYPYPERDPADEARRLVVGSPSHLLEMNHSPKFWSKVAVCCPDWKRQRAWLRAHGAGLQSAGE